LLGGASAHFLLFSTKFQANLYSDTGKLRLSDNSVSYQIALVFSRILAFFVYSDETCQGVEKQFRGYYILGLPKNKRLLRIIGKNKTMYAKLVKKAG
jgi:hypothetical protein